MKIRGLFSIPVENFKMKAEPTTLPQTHTPPQAHNDNWWLWQSVGQSPRDSPGTWQAVKTTCSAIPVGVLPQNNPSKNHSAVSLFFFLGEAVPSHDGHCYGTGSNPKNIKSFRTIAGAQLLSGAALMSPGLCRDIQRKTEWSLTTGMRPAHYWFR